MKKIYIMPKFYVRQMNLQRLLTLSKEGSDDYSGGNSSNPDTSGGDGGETDGDGFTTAKGNFISFGFDE